MFSIDELLLQIAILAKICIKMRCKNLHKAGGFTPRPPCLRRLGLRPKTSNHPLRIPGYATAPHHSFNAEYLAGEL